MTQNFRAALVQSIPGFGIVKKIINNRKNILKKVFVGFFVMLCMSIVQKSWSQIYVHDFGTTTILSHPYTVTPPKFDANLTNSSWSNSTNAWTSFNGSSGEAIAISNSSGTPTITLTFNVNSGYECSITSYSFWSQRSTTGAQNYSMTINGIAVGSGTIPTSGSGTGTIPVANPVNNQTGTITVVISLSGASGGGTFRLDDFTLNGTVSLVPPVTNTSTGETFSSIQAAIDAPNTVNGNTITVAAGTYNEDVIVNKSVTITGANAATTIVSGPKGGDNATFRIAASGVIIENFTITRDGNNTTEWNDPTLNSAGVAIQSQGNTATIRHNIITGNRTGIDINNANGNTITENQIDFNRTGLLFRNQTDNTTMTDNFIRDNWTVGVLFLDASGGTNVPVQSAVNSQFNDNNISGNWYGDIVDRQSGGSLPTPGTSNMKNFECNWYGVLSPVVSVANSSEPGYAAQIPLVYGGTATNPGGAPNILGPASANFDYISWLVNGTDDQAGTPGFQPVPGSCSGGPVHNITQNTYYGTIQSAIDDITTVDNDIIEVAAGTYTEAVTVNKILTIKGANAGIAAGNDPGSRGAESIVDGGIYLTTASIIDGFKIINGAQLGGSSFKGIFVLSANATVANTIVENVTGSQSSGIEVGYYNNFSLTNSSVINNWRGIYLNPSSGDVLFGNLIDGNSYGIGSDGLTNFSMTGSSITNNSQEGWGASSVGSSVMANNNIIANNSTVSIAHYGGSAIDANCNWWGQANGPAPGQNSGSVTADTYLTSGTDASPGTPGFQPTGTCIGPVHNITQNTYYGTIQSAIDAANASDVIEAAAGTYNENITVTKALTIKGANFGVSCFDGSRVAESVINGIQGSGTSTITVSSDNVTIDGFTITNALGSFGISENGKNNLDFEHNIITNIGNSTSGSGTSWGVYLEAGNTANSSSINVSNNCINNIRGGANTSLTGAAAKANNGSGGAILIASSNATKDISGITISSNKIDNCTANTSDFANGGKGAYGMNVSVGSAGPASVSSLVIQDNEITNLEGLWAHGIGLEGRTPGAIVSNNMIDNLVDHKSNTDAIGVQVEANDGAASVDIHENSLTNMAYGIQNVTALTVNATCNWFGASDAATIATKINGPVTYTPFLNNGTDNSTSIGFQPVPGSCTCPGGMVTNVNTSETFCSIQAAIDAPNTVDGNTIQVSAGTYAEDIVVNKELTILGPNANVDPCSGSRVTEAIVVPATAAISAGEIFHVAASNVTISGFTIDGDNPLLNSGFTSTNGADIDAAEGITVYEDNINNLTVTNNIVQNLTYFGVTIFGASYSAPSTSGHIISNNKIQDLGTYDASSGINLWGGGVLLYNDQYAAVTNNCMTNVRLGVQTGNFHAANPGTNASQIIAGNTIQTRRLGIFHNLFNSLASAYTIDNNNITGLSNANETYWDGIKLTSLADAVHTASNNTVDGSGSTAANTTGINVWNDQMAPLIMNSSITGVKIGINVNNYEGYNNSNANNTLATIDNVTITNASDAGIKIHDNPLNTNNATVGVEIKGNTEISGSPIGIWVLNSDASANIHDNGATITGNIVGIEVDGGNLDPLYRNNITGNGTGVKVTNSGTLGLTTENFITNNTSDGILIEASAGAIGDINSNDISGNSGYAINNLSIPVLSATCNWYGSTVKTFVDNKIHGPVTYSPWLINGTDNEPATSGFQPVPGSCKTVVIADPAIVDVVITDMSDNQLPDYNTIPLNSQNRIKLTILNNSFSNAIPSGTTKIRIDLGDRFTLDPSFVLSSAALSTYFTWTKVVESGHDVIYGDQIADIPAGFGYPGYPGFPGNQASFDVIAAPAGTSDVIADFQVTNHNNPTYFLEDANNTNNHVEANYTVLESLELALDHAENVTCFGGNDGSITVIASGGAVPYQYSLTGGAPWQASPTFNGLAAGPYTVTVQDNIGQTATVNYTVTQLPELTATVAGNNITCNGLTNGSIVISAPGGGSGAYEYRLDAGTWGTSTTFSGLATGTYSVQIRDQAHPGCEKILASITISEPTIVVISDTHVDVLCNGSATGSIDLAVSGGTPGYTYAWTASGGAIIPSGQEDDQDLNGLTAGTYSVVVTDANGCAQASYDVVITQNTPVVASGTQVNVTCNGGSNGSIDLTVSGGSGSYTYLWSNGATTQDISGLAAGTYTVAITESNGCTVTGTTSFTITQNDPVVASGTQVNVNCNGGSTGSIDLTVTGGSGSYTYSWSNGATTQDISGLAAGTYSVIISESNGCAVTGTTSFTITQNDPVVAGGTQVNVSCNGSSTGSIDLTVSGGSGSYTYLWSNGATTQDISGLAAGIYTVTITESNGCAVTGTTSFTITEPPVLNADVTAINQILCYGSNSGSVTVTATGGTPTYEYSLDAGSYQPGGTFTGLTPGSHNVVAKDANGCTKSVSFTITEPQNSDITLGSQFTSNLFPTNGVEVTVMYNVSEIGGRSATPATIYIIRPAGYNLSINTASGQTLTIGANTYTLDNDKWELNQVGSTSTYALTRTGPGGNNTIDCNTYLPLRVAIKVTRATPNKSKFNLIASFLPVANEVITSNNTTSIIMTAQ